MPGSMQQEKQKNHFKTWLYDSGQKISCHCGTCSGNIYIRSVQYTVDETALEDYSWYRILQPEYRLE